MAKSKQNQLFETEPPLPEKMPWELAAELDRELAQVVFNRPMETVYHYLVPDELRDQLRSGQRVKVPFGAGNKTIIGYCVGTTFPDEVKHKLKPLHSILDPQPLLSPMMLELTQWIAERYLCSWGQVLNCVIPAGVKNQAGTRVVTFFGLADGVAEALTTQPFPPKQKAVLELLRETDQPLRMDEITRAANCGPGPVRTLRKKGYLRTIKERTEPADPTLEEIERVDDLTLNDEQGRALDSILNTLRTGEHRTILLRGVTGSGKTEVYIQAIREVVSYGRQAIVLVPEISLTPQTIRRFRARFDSVAVLHSHLSDAERHHHWQRIAEGRVQVIVGARSAVFAPTPHLGLIIIDEEHETSFKQETVPRYHAREVSRKRAELEQVPLILGSATPTLESWQRVLPIDQPNENELAGPSDMLLTMENRVASLPLPPVILVDTRNDPRIRKGEAIGRVLRTSIQQALNDGGQVILFLNLRGFSPTLWCRSCGEAVKCKSCDITLTWHKDRHIALCHFCDYETPPPAACPACQQPGVRYFGTGTQKLEQEVRAKFPDQRCLRMDSDSMRKPGSHDAALESFRNGEVQILLGTQMIAKGLDFPNVTLVGVIDADTMLHQPDLRATERTFQLIAQVAGRTGRSDKGGRVYVQSSCPGEPAIQHAVEHDFLGFARDELAHRKEMLSPPFTHLARVILRGPKEQEVEQVAEEFAEALRHIAEEDSFPVQILGPAPAPLAKLKDHHRYHFQLSAKSVTSIQQLWRAVEGQIPTRGNVEFVIDVDPVNMR